MRRRVEKVRLGSRSYDIVIGPGALAESKKRKEAFGSRALVVSNRSVFDQHGGALTVSLEQSGVDYDTLLLPEGERHKTVRAVQRIHDRLVAKRFDRSGVVVAFGGGVVGDIAGFAAATYMRGIKVVQAPTTLLSQVDSSVGGKTGVNHPKGKNLIGAFWQPSLVLADTETLRTLPRDEILCGVAEIIKYSCIASKRFMSFLEKNMAALVSLDDAVVIKAVATSCRIKADVVSRDEREGGARAILNFGHTAGHAIEAVTGYRRYRHGYAVAIGMRVAAELSLLLGRITAKEKKRIAGLIELAGLPAVIPHNISDRKILSAMRHDKKAASGAIRFALLNGIGEASGAEEVEEAMIREALRLSRI